MKWRMACSCALLMALACSTAQAQQLVYTPRDPSFGGNPFNSTQLLALANAQNQDQKSVSSTGNTQTEAQLFAQELQSRLLSSLADSVTNAIFGANPQNQGTFSFGGETVSYVRDLNNITLTLTDATGAVTTIVVPNNVQIR